MFLDIVIFVISAPTPATKVLAKTIAKTTNTLIAYLNGMQELAIRVQFTKRNFS